MWNFEHPPEAQQLRTRYSIQKMTPAQCAQQLRTGQADLGLIPIAEYATIPGLAIVPGCNIASLGAIRSILLVVRPASRPLAGAPSRAGLGNRRPALPPAILFASSPAAQASPTNPDALTPAVLEDLLAVQTVALDTASRTSAMYTRILFAKYWNRTPRFLPHSAELDTMLASADAALLIGDPALHALEDRAAREQRTGECLHYLDLGAAWRAQSGLPWVSAFWAVRTAALSEPAPSHSALPHPATIQQVTRDCTASRDAGLAHLPALADQWSERLRLPRATIETYLCHNIHYTLDPACLQGIAGFYADAEECGLIPSQPPLHFL
jgi:chorismate dehydratase